MNTDGTVTDGPRDKAYIGGFSVIDVATTRCNKCNKGQVLNVAARLLASVDL